MTVTRKFLRELINLTGFFLNKHPQLRQQPIVATRKFRELINFEGKVIETNYLLDVCYKKLFRELVQGFLLGNFGN